MSKHKGREVLEVPYLLCHHNHESVCWFWFTDSYLCEIDWLYIDIQMTRKHDDMCEFSLQLKEELRIIRTQTCRVYQPKSLSTARTTTCFVCQVLAANSPCQQRWPIVNVASDLAWSGAWGGLASSTCPMSGRYNRYHNSTHTNMPEILPQQQNT